MKAFTIYDQIKSRLETDTKFRERRFRDTGLIALILEKRGKESAMFVDINFLPDFAKDYTSYERIWRACLQENPELRGDDWRDGKALSQEFQIEVLNREVGYHGDVKKLAHL